MIKSNLRFIAYAKQNNILHQIKKQRNMTQLNYNLKNHTDGSEDFMHFFFTLLTKMHIYNLYMISANMYFRRHGNKYQPPNQKI